MAWPEARRMPARAAQRAQARARARRLRRIVVITVMLSIGLPALVLVALGTETSTAPVPVGLADRLLPAGPPAPQIVALQGSLRISLPIAQNQITAIGYHGVGDGALPLDPVGTQANAGFFTRLYHRLFGEPERGLRYVLLEGGRGPQTAGLDIGAPVEADVYAPVDGTVIGISDRILNGERFGVQIEIQPSDDPGFVVSLANLSADPALTVGSPVAAARTKIGSVLDLSEVERAALARYTQDNGAHLHLEVHPALNPSIP